MRKAVLMLLGTVCLSVPILAQARRAPEPDVGAACGMVGCGIFVWLLMIFLVFAISIAVMVVIFRFIKRDAIARGLPPTTAMPWLALLGLLGLLIYVLQRPQGNVLPCPSCRRKRMQGLPRCPNCGNP